MNNKFTQWSQLIMCNKIKPNEKVVLMVILNCNNMGWTYIAHSEIMRQSGLSESTTKRVLTKLKKNGLINEVKSEVNNMNNYIVSGFNLNGLMENASINEAETDTNGFNLNGLIENETHENSQVGSNLTTSGFNLTYKNKRIKRENIEKKKEKEIYKEKEKRKSVTKDTSNLQVLPDNNNNKIKLNMSKQITNNPKNGNPNDNSHCFSDSGSGCDNPNNLQIQASGRDNTKNGDNPNKTEMNNPKATRPTTAEQNTNPKTVEYNHEDAGATETAHIGFNGAQVDNYPNHTDKMPQEANKWANQGNGTHSPMNGYIPIDELEDIYNGGQTIPKPQSKAATPIQPTEEDVKYLTISKWNQTMRNIKTKVETDTKLNQSDLHALFEGSQDPMRVIDTLKTIKMLINNFIRLNCYWRFLDECEITIPTIRSDKQRKYAKDLLKECDKYYDQYRNMLKKII